MGFWHPGYDAKRLLFLSSKARFFGQCPDGGRLRKRSYGRLRKPSSRTSKASSASFIAVSASGFSAIQSAASLIAPERQCVKASIDTAELPRNEGIDFLRQNDGFAQAKRPPVSPDAFKGKSLRNRQKRTGFLAQNRRLDIVANRGSGANAVDDLRLRLEDRRELTEKRTWS